MKETKEPITYKELRLSTGREIEELLEYAANDLIEDCEHCAILELCESQDKYTCCELWAKYLKGEIHGEA